MDTGLDTQAGPNSTALAERLRARDPEAMTSFLGSWSEAVDRYCRTVCEPGLVAEAVEVAFADFLEKVDSHPIRDSHLESALMRSTRLTAAEAARVDWDEPGVPEDDLSPGFGCELTPLLLAGSPSAPASVEALARMDEHVRACPRCQASARRFDTAEKAFQGSKEDAEIQPESGPPPDTRIGEFRIVAIGREDPDGVVFCTALDEQAEQVALRLAAADEDPDFKSRFLRDARLLAGLAHPSLPAVRAFGEVPEGAYIVTEELRSRSLASVLERGLPTKQAVRMLVEVADALDAAHAVGLLHRQLNPANVVVGAWLVVRPLVVNFALGRSPDVVRNGEQTPYLSPEEIRGETVGPAADRYALACTLFELLAGRPPFGKSRDAAVHGHLNEPSPRASGVRTNLPPTLDAVFERALSKSPDERFASAAELASEVTRAMFGPAAPSPSEPVADAAPGRGGDPPTHEMDGAAASTDRVASETGPPPDVAESHADGARTRRRLIATAVATVGAIIVVATLLSGGSSDHDRGSSPERTPTAPVEERERRVPVKPSPPASLPVVLAGAKATDYDPNGGNGEHPEKVGALIDGDVKTEWQTELYPTGTFGRGVGAYIALPKAQSLKEVEIRTTTPGWDAEVYGASAGPPPALPAPGWTKLGSRSRVRRVERIDLVAGSQPVRYCLVWITKPPAGGLVSMAEVRLFR